MSELPPLHAVIEAPGALTPGERWEIEGLQLERVQFRGVRPGEAFTVRDGSGRWFRARLHRRGLEMGAPFVAEIFEAMAGPEPTVRLALLQAVLARERMFWVVQKATELGVHWILPVFTTRSLGPDDLAREKAHRWPAAILRAVAQCRRGTVPVLLPPRSLPEAFAHPLWQEAVIRQALVEGGRRDGARKEFAHPVTGAALLVGPEGGWTTEELLQIRESAGASICLGGRILRAETAAVVGLTLLQQAYGDLRI
jgi:16S rRNA (uracil1498-N3)-methyltransferase